MTVLHRTIAVLSLILLGAHFFRAGVPPAIIAVGLAASVWALFLERPFAARAVQVVLVLGALEWVRAAVVLAGRREAIGEPYVRLLVILGSVAVLALVAALAFQHRAIAHRYGLQHRSSQPRPGIDSTAPLG